MQQYCHKGLTFFLNIYKNNAQTNKKLHQSILDTFFDLCLHGIRLYFHIFTINLRRHGFRFLSKKNCTDKASIILILKCIYVNNNNNNNFISILKSISQRQVLPVKKYYIVEIFLYFWPNNRPEDILAIIFLVGQRFNI